MQLLPVRKAKSQRKQSEQRTRKSRNDIEKRRNIPKIAKVPEDSLPVERRMRKLHALLVPCQCYHLLQDIRENMNANVPDVNETSG